MTWIKVGVHVYALLQCFEDQKSLKSHQCHTLLNIMRTWRDAAAVFSLVERLITSVAYRHTEIMATQSEYTPQKNYRYQCTESAIRFHFSHSPWLNDFCTTWLTLGAEVWILPPADRLKNPDFPVLIYRWTQKFCLERHKSVVFCSKWFMSTLLSFCLQNNITLKF